MLVRALIALKLDDLMLRAFLEFITNYVAIYAVSKLRTP